MDMTLPFENDTNAVVKKLAKQNIKANYRTVLSIMSAILIAATFYVVYPETRGYGAKKRGYHIWRQDITVIEFLNVFHSGG